MKGLLADGTTNTLKTHETWAPRNTMWERKFLAAQRRPHAPHAFTWDTYGLGWKLGTYRGYRMHFHAGDGAAGYSNFITVLPEINVGVVILSNPPVDHRYPMRT